METSKSIAFARTLALASTLLVPACASSSSEPEKAPVEAEKDAASSSVTNAPVDAGAEDALAASNDAGEVDAGKISGPLPPPELPASMA